MYLHNTYRYLCVYIHKHTDTYVHTHIWYEYILIFKRNM